MILGRGMSRAGGDEPTTTSTTLDDEALARVLQRSLEAKVATGEQQLQSDEQTAQALQVYNRVTRCLAQPKHGERRWVLYFLPYYCTVQAVWEAEEAKEDTHPVRFCALAFACADTYVLYVWATRTSLACCTYVLEAQGSSPPGRHTHCTYAVHVPASGVPCIPRTVAAQAFVGCVIGFTLEIQQNGWAFLPQPTAHS